MASIVRILVTKKAPDWCGLLCTKFSTFFLKKQKKCHFVWPLEPSKYTVYYIPLGHQCPICLVWVNCKYLYYIIKNTKFPNSLVFNLRLFRSGIFEDDNEWRNEDFILTKSAENISNKVSFSRVYCQLKIEYNTKTD